MIEITDKKDCTGCNACTQRCPVGCITMTTDDEGFRYPIVDKDTCIRCGLCERVCPVINQSEPRLPLESLAAKNCDRQVRMASSSGGVFHALATKIIEEGGVVFGARFNNKWEVEHAYAETMDGVTAFQGSKYVQSSIGNTFTEAERFLKDGRKVLFTGTPCQIAGLLRFLRKDYSPLLITVDVACHGVPSPTIWQDYLTHITPDNDRITSISFRSKKISWEDFGLQIIFSDGNEHFRRVWKDDYMFCFLRNITLRPSCYACPAKEGKSNSDITLGDLWGASEISPSLFDNTGTSFALANTSAGRELLKHISMECIPAEYGQIAQHNSALVHSVKEPLQRKTFWNEYRRSGITALQVTTRRLTPSIFKRLVRKIKHLLHL